ALQSSSARSGAGVLTLNLSGKEALSKPNPSAAAKTECIHAHSFPRSRGPAWESNLRPLRCNLGLRLLGEYLQLSNSGRITLAAERPDAHSHAGDAGAWERGAWI